MVKKKVIEESEPIHEFFGLSYSNYLVLPRSVLQSMPKDWQEKLVCLVRRISEVIDEEFELEGGYDVRARDSDSHFITDPYSNYERGRRRLELKEIVTGKLENK